MTIPPDYFELREAAEKALPIIKAWNDFRGECDHDVGMCLCADRFVERDLRKALSAGDERNGIEVVAGDKAWPHGQGKPLHNCACPSAFRGCRAAYCPRRDSNRAGHIALALDGGMKETT